jgi:hypothetical protein
VACLPGLQASAKNGAIVAVADAVQQVHLDLARPMFYAKARRSSKKLEQIISQIRRILTSHGSADVAKAVGEAALVELPLAALCFWIVRSARRRGEQRKRRVTAGGRDRSPRRCRHRRSGSVSYRRPRARAGRREPWSPRPACTGTRLRRAWGASTRCPRRAPTPAFPRKRCPVRALGAQPFHRSTLLRHSCPGPVISQPTTPLPSSSPRCARGSALSSRCLLVRDVLWVGPSR